MRSAQAVIEAIDRKKLEVLPVAITKEGKWLPPAQSAQLLPEHVQSSLTSTLTTSDVALLGDPSHKGLISIEHNSNAGSAETLDVIFPVLHGPFGEDGTLQG